MNNKMMAQKVKEMRTRKGFSQEQLADASQINLSVYHHQYYKVLYWEKGVLPASHYFFKIIEQLHNILNFITL